MYANPIPFLWWEKVLGAFFGGLIVVSIISVIRTVSG